MNGRSNVLTIKTPEGIVFSLQLAGPTTRFMAWFIDACVIVVIFTVLSTLASLIVAMSVSWLSFVADWAVALMGVILFVTNIGYGIVLEYFWRGQTVGKYVLRLRVMDEQGLQLQFSQVAVRNLMRLVDSMPVFYLFGGIACVLSKRCQRLGDYAANTIVTFSPKLATPDFEQILGGKYNSLRDFPHLEARLRHRVTPEEARLALQAVIRRDSLTPEARVELFSEIADHFRSLVSFPEEATLGVADEQYVRNVVDCLFRPQGSGVSAGRENARGAA